MTIANGNAYKELAWTGVETSFNPEFTAERVEDVTAKYLSDAGVLTDLTRGVHFSASLGAGSAVTVAPLSMPAAPGTIQILRDSQVVQGTDFENGEDFDAAIHETLFDRLFRLAGEIKRDILLKIGPYTVLGGIVDFRPYIIRAADPVGDNDVATRGWVLDVTGLLNLTAYVTAAAASAAAAAASAVSSAVAQVASEAARDMAQLWAEQNEDVVVATGPTRYSAKHWAAKANAAAAIILPYLTQTDDGLFGDPDTGSQDDGAF